jgi:NAD(P)-dependent dehydrogenase (short-subunit alcohol dehydrogenase family)
MNPVALITGASRGIGRGIAVELAKTGYDLVLNFASNRGAAETASQEVQNASRAAGQDVRAALCQADISEAADRTRLLAFTRETYGRLDILVNNAGVAPRQRVDLLEATEESFDRLIRVNLKSPYFLTQEAAKWMIQQVEAQPAGESDSSFRPKIVTISSVSAYAASVNRGDYCVAKAGLSMLTRLYAARLAPYGINVYEIRPGIIATDMTQPVQQKYDALIRGGLTPIQRWGAPADVGKCVAAIAMDLLPFSTGEVINVDGGLHLHRL